MALEQAKKFLEELRTSDKVKELLKDKEQPTNIEEAISLYLDVAKELGYDLKGEDLLSAIKEAANGQGAGEKELSLDEMEKASGGSSLMDWLTLNVGMPILRKAREIKKDLSNNLTPENVTNDLEQQMKDIEHQVRGY